MSVAMNDSMNVATTLPEGVPAAHNRRIPMLRDFALEASPCRCHRKGRRSHRANDAPPDNASTLPRRKLSVALHHVLPDQRG